MHTAQPTQAKTIKIQHNASKSDIVALQEASMGNKSETFMRVPEYRLIPMGTRMGFYPTHFIRKPFSSRE